MKKCLAGCCLLMSLCVASSCTTKNNQRTDKVKTTEESAFSGVHIVPEYARGFELSYRDGYVLLDIQDPQNEESTTFHYALVRRGTKPAGIPESYTVIETPIRSVICMTSLQLSNFIKMGELDKVVGVTSTRHLFNREMNERLKSGKTAKIGIEGNFDNEVIMSMNPDLILVSPFKRGGYETLKDVGIPLIPHLGYKEMTPLGQAEWVKFVGLLVGQEQKANETFDAIAARYNELKELTAEGKVKKRPVVLSGEMRGGNWYAVGGESFLAQLFKDAGADYFLKDDKRSGGVTFDFETVYNQGDEADYWRIVNSYPGTFSYEALKEQDPRYEDFRQGERDHLLQHERYAFLRKYADRAGSRTGRPAAYIPSGLAARSYACLLCPTQISCTNETFYYFSYVAHRSVYPGPDVPEFGVRIGVYPVEVCLEHYLRTGRRAGDLAEYRLEITSSAGIDCFGGGSGLGDKRLADADCFPESAGGAFRVGDQFRCEYGRGLRGVVER